MVTQPFRTEKRLQWFVVSLDSESKPNQVVGKMLAGPGESKGFLLYLGIALFSWCHCWRDVCNWLPLLICLLLSHRCSESKGGHICWDSVSWLRSNKDGIGLKQGLFSFLESFPLWLVLDSITFLTQWISWWFCCFSKIWLKLAHLVKHTQ